MLPVMRLKQPVCIFNNPYPLLMRPILVPLIVGLLWLSAISAYADIRLSGLDSGTQENVRLMLSLSRENCQSPDWKVRNLFSLADQEIDQGLRALGYYHGAIDKKLSHRTGCWQADFVVNAGARVQIKDMAIDYVGISQDDKDLQKLRKKLLKNVGSPLNHGIYEDMKTKIDALAREQGYLQGRFTKNQLLIDTQLNVAYIKLEYTAGKRRVFGNITLNQSILNPDFVSHYIAIKTGDFYTSEQLAKTHNDLAKSGYFERVDIHPEPENADASVPITINLEAKKHRHYAIGIGYDTDIGPLISAAYENRRLNQRGHFLNTALDVSPVLSTLDAEYSAPLSDPTNDFASMGVGLKREDTQSFKTLSAKLSGRLKHALDQGWKQTLFLDLDYEDFQIGSNTTQTLLLVPGGSWLKSVSNNAMRPSKGYRLKWDVSGSYKNPLSDVSFVQAALSATYLYPLPWRSKFIGHSELGATWADQFELLPTSYRFYAGGINSIRGYAYKELGPKDNQGLVVGGRFLTVLSMEVEKAVFNEWGIAAFLDTGNAYNPDNILLKTGVGLGVRWYSPFGPVRVDFALPLNDADSSFQIHFAAGARI